MKKVLLRLSVSVISSFFICFSFAQAGTLDSTFGVNGKLITNVGKYEYSLTSAEQTDGKILIGGASDSSWILIRYNQDGSLDSSFGIMGKSIVTFNKNYSDGIRAITIQPNGKIIAAGISNGIDFTIIRFKINGSIDNSFGNVGMVTTHFGPYAFPTGIAVQSDKKIIVGGYGKLDELTFLGSQFIIARYNENGTLDSSFNKIGKQYALLGGTENNAEQVKIQSDGKIIQGGSTTINGNDYLGIIRFNTDGSIDSSFGNYGISVVYLNSNGYYWRNTFMLQHDDKIICSGGSYSYTFANPQYASFNLARINANGTIDSSFGINGKTFTKISSNSFDFPFWITEDKDKKIIQGGTSFTTTNTVNAFTTIRYLENGTVDSSYGTYGKQLTYFDNITSVSYTGLIQNDNKIFVAGYSGFGAQDFAMARYKKDDFFVSIKKNISVTEGNSSTTPAKFNIVLNKAATTSVTVNYTTKDLSAKSGSDFTAKSGTVTFPVGVVNRAVTINVTGDNIVEPNERFALVLSNPVNATLGTIDSVICIIKNDDPSFAKNSITTEQLETVKTIKLYPNPTKDVLRIEGLSIKQKTAVSIIDMNGKTLSTSIVTTSIYYQDIKQLSPGAYFVKIESGNKSETLKFIKQ